MKYYSLVARFPTKSFFEITGDEPEQALISYTPDESVTPDGRTHLRAWKTALAFTTPPPSPIECYIDEGEGGELLDFKDATICLFSRRAEAALRAAGVTNIETYDAIIKDFNTGQTHTSHVAVNVVGVGPAPGRHVFRNEAGDVTVDETVRQALLDAGVENLDFDEGELEKTTLHVLGHALYGADHPGRVK